MATRSEAGTRSITHNFIFSSLSTVLNVIVPLVTYPYVARVLGPVAMGKLGVASSLANYFIVGALLGLPVYGVREIAKSTQSQERLSKTGTELFILGLIAALLSTCIYVLVVVAVPRYRGDSILFLIFGSTILGSNLSIDWFFQGIEKFRFIGVRNVIMKASFVLALFLLVRSQHDYILYAALFAAANVATAIVNLWTSKRYLKPQLRGIAPARHLGPMFVFMVFSFAITAYTNLDFLFLGLFSTDSEAGLYSISIRLVRMIVTVSATLSVVLFPRLSAIVDNEPGEYTRILRASAASTAMFVLPACAGLVTTAEDLATAFAGNAFTDAAGSLRITAFIVPIVAASNLLQMQILVPKGREKATLLSFAAGFAAAALVLALCVKPYGHIGAAWGMLAGEVAVLIVQIRLCGSSLISSLLDKKALLVYGGGALLCGIAARAPQLFMDAGISRLVVSTFMGAGVYAVFLVVLKDERAVALLRSISRKRLNAQ